MKVAGALLPWVSCPREHLGCVEASRDADVKGTVALEGRQSRTQRL